MLKSIVALAAVLLLGCAPSPSDVYAQRRILFIGNSLTYYNDLPATVRAIAQAAGEDIYVAAAAEPNLALIDHLNGQSNALSLLRSGGWDFVVLQQGPTTIGVNRDSLILWTEMFEPHIEKAGARAALFMVWPRQSSMAWMDSVRVSYEQAARAVNGVFLPAGEAWRFALQEDATLKLYGPDAFHPDELGTYLAALVIYARLANVDPRTLPGRVFAGGRQIVASVNTVQVLQRAAFEALRKY